MDNAIGSESGYENLTPSLEHRVTNVSTRNSQPPNGRLPSGNANPSLDLFRNLTTDEAQEWADYHTARKLAPSSPETAKAKHVLFSRYQKLAKKAAQRYASYCLPYRSLMEECDIESEAYVGLLDAIENYNCGVGVDFHGFSRRRIFGAIIDGLRKLQNFSRFVSRARRELKPLIEALSQELHRIPTTEELIERYPYHRIGDEFLPQVLRHPLVGVNVFNQSARSNNSQDGNPDDDCDNVSVLEDGLNGTACRAHQAQQAQFDFMHRCDLISKTLNHLQTDVGERQVIYYYYFLGMTSREIAVALKMSLTWVSTKKVSAISRLKRLSKIDPELRDLLSQ